MADEHLVEEQEGQEAFFDWLTTLEHDVSLAELIQEHPEWAEPLQFDAEELERLERLVPEYAQELADRDLLPDSPQIDIDERLLREPEHDIDLDFDH